MKIFKKSVAKVAVALLLAVITLTLCIFGGGQSVKPAIAETESETTPFSSITLSADKTELHPGDELNLTLEISSTRVGLPYHSYQFDIEFMNVVGNSSEELVKSNFELVSCISSNDEYGTGYIPFFDRNDLDELSFTFIYSMGVDDIFTSDCKDIWTITLKVKEHAQPVESFDFGIKKTRKNNLAFEDKETNKTIRDHAGDSTLLAVNSISMSLKQAAKSSVTLSASKTELKAGDYFVISLEASTTKTDLNWSALNLVVGPLNSDKSYPSSTLSPYFEYVSHTKNVDMQELTFSNFQNAEAGYNQGFRITATFPQGIQCTQKIVFAIIFKVKEGAPAVENFDFGIAPLTTNYLTFSDGLDSSVSSLTTNTIPMSISVA